MKDIRRCFIILIAGVLIGSFAKFLQSRKSLKLETQNIKAYNHNELLNLIDNNTALFFDKYRENFISKAIRFYNLNANYRYDISRFNNDKTDYEISFIKISIGDDFFYLSRETRNER